MNPRLARDLMTGWSYNDPEHITMAEEWQREERLQLNNSSSQCKSFLTLWTLGGPRDPVERVEVETEGIENLRMCVEMHKVQSDNEKHFVQEHTQVPMNQCGTRRAVEHRKD